MNPSVRRRIASLMLFLQLFSIVPPAWAAGTWNETAPLSAPEETLPEGKGGGYEVASMLLQGGVIAAAEKLTTRAGDVTLEMVGTKLVVTYTNLTGATTKGEVALDDISELDNGKRTHYGVRGLTSALQRVTNGATLINALSQLTAASVEAALTRALNPVAQPAKLVAYGLKSAKVGSSLALFLVVQFQNASGNEFKIPSGSSRDVTVSKVSGPGDLKGATTVKVDAGKSEASFSGLTVEKVGTYQLKFTSGDLSAEATLIVGAGAAAKLVILTQLAGAEPGKALTTQPRIGAVDKFGHAVPNYLAFVEVAIASGNGTLTASRGRAPSEVSTSDGVATFEDLTIDKAGTYTLKFTDKFNSNLTVTSASFVVAVPAPAITSLNPTVAKVGASVTATGTGFTDQTTLTVAGKPATITARTATTLTFTIPAGIEPWFYSVVAKNGSAASNEASFTVTDDPAKVSWAGTGRVYLTAGEVSPFAINVRVENAAGRRIVGQAIPVTVSLVGNGTLQGTLQRKSSSGSGMATFNDLRVDQAGQYSLRFTLPNGASKDMELNVEPADAAKLEVVTQPAGATPGRAFTTQPVVRCLDAFGNVVDRMGAFTASVASGPGTLSGRTEVHISNRVATYENLALSAAGTYTLKFVSGNLTVTSAPFTVAALPVATSLAVTTQPSGATAGTTLATQPKVEIRDQYGKVMTSFAGEVTAAIASGNGRLSGTAKVRAVNGVATFTNLALTNGTFTLRFSSPRLTDATSSSLTLDYPAAAKLRFNGTPRTTFTAGVDMPDREFLVEIVEADGTLARRDADKVREITITAAKGDPGVAGTSKVKASGSQASFHSAIFQTPGTHTIKFTSPGLPDLELAITVTAAGPAKLAVSAPEPASPTAGQDFSVTVTAQAANGQTVTNYTGAVTLWLWKGTTNVALSGTGVTNGAATVNAVNGVATFTGLRTANAGTDLNFGARTVVGGKNVDAYGSKFNIAAPPPVATSLSFTTQPAGATASTAFTTQPVVTVRDQNGRTMTTYTGAVAVAIKSGTGTSGAQLLGTKSVNVAAGVATFAGLSVDKAGTGYALTATSGTLTAVSSNAFAVAVAVPTAGQLGTMTPEQFRAIAPEAFGKMTSAQLRAFTPQQIKAMTPEQFRALREGVNFAATFSKAQIAAFSPENLKLLQPAQLGRFSNEQLQALTQDQRNALTAEQKAGLTDAQRRLIGIRPEIETSSTISAAAFKALTPAAINALTVARIQVVEAAAFAGLRATQTKALKPDHLKALSDAQFGTLNGDVNFSTAFTATQMAAFKPDHIKLIAPAQIGRLTNEQLKALTAEQAAALTAQQRAALTAEKRALLPLILAATAPTTAPAITPTSVTAGQVLTCGTVTWTGVSAFNYQWKRGTANIDGATSAAYTTVAADAGQSITCVVTPRTAAAGYKLPASVQGAISNAVSVAAVVAPARMSVASSWNASANKYAGTQRIVIEFLDAAGQRFASGDARDITVALVGSGELRGTKTVRSVDGQAAFRDLAIERVGTYSLRFTSPGVPDYTLENIRILPSLVPGRLEIVTQPVGGTAGQPLATQPRVRLLDRYGNAMDGSAILLDVSIASGNGTVRATDNHMGGDAGRASLFFENSDNTVADCGTIGLVVNNAGPFTLKFTLNQFQDVTVTSASFTVTQPLAATAPTTAPAITPTSVTAGQVLTCGTVSWTGVSAFNYQWKRGTANIDGATAASYTTVAADAGQSLTCVVTPRTAAAGYRLPTGVQGATSNAVTPAAAVVATKLGFVSEEFTGVIDQTPMARDVQVEILDANNRRVTSSTARVTLALDPQYGTSGTVLGPASALAVNAVAGVATFRGLTFDRPGAGYQFRASAPGLEGIQMRLSITVNPSTALGVNAITVDPTTVTRGNAIAFSLRPKDYDAFVRRAGGASSLATTVQAAVFKGLTSVTTLTPGTPTGGAIPFRWTVPATTDTGDYFVMAKFSGALLEASSAQFRVAAAAPAATAATTTTTLTATQATALTAAQIGALTPEQFKALPPSAFENFSPTQIAAFTPAQIAVMTGDQFQTFKGGAIFGRTLTPAQFAALSPDNLKNLQPTQIARLTEAQLRAMTREQVLALTANQRLALTAEKRAIIDAIANAASTATTAASSGATKLGITAQPTSATAGEAFSPVFTVEVRNASGAKVATAANAITASVASGPGALLGTANVTAANGVATFTGLRIERAGTYTVKFVATGLTEAISTSFEVQAGAPSKAVILGTQTSSLPSGITGTLASSGGGGPGQDGDRLRSEAEVPVPVLTDAAPVRVASFSAPIGIFSLHAATHLILQSLITQTGGLTIEYQDQYGNRSTATNGTGTVTINGVEVSVTIVNGVATVDQATLTRKGIATPFTLSAATAGGKAMTVAKASESRTSVYGVPGVYSTATSNPTPSDNATVILQPSNVTLVRGEARQFTASIKNNPTGTLRWTATGGTISQTGLYTAPQSVGVFKVKAQALSDARKFAEAQVIVGSVLIDVLPSTVSLATGGTQQFTATVKGLGNPGVTWTTTGGTVSNTGLYTAPATAGTYTVRAAATADATKFVEATVTVKEVKVAIDPVTAAAVTGGTIQFSASVEGAANSDVIWSVVTASGGTINSTGLYMAPNTAGSYRIRATSQANPSKFAEAVVSVTDVSITVTPASATMFGGASRQFSGTVSGVPNGGSTGVTWTASQGTVTAGGLYTAPEQAGEQTVRATSVVDQRKFADAAVTVEVVSVGVTPAAPIVSEGQTAQLTASVTGTANTAVTWSVVTAGGGTINSRGLYTAPNKAGTYTVRATSVADTRKFAEATVTVPAAPVDVATNLVVSAPNPASPTANSDFTVTVTAKSGTGTDAATFTGFTGTVTLSLSGGTGTLSGTGVSNGVATATAVAGVATFSGLRISGAGTAYALAASSGTGATAISGRSGLFTVRSASSNAGLDIQTPKTVTGLQIASAQASIAVGATQQLAATATFSDNTTQAVTESATWQSSATNVATVSARGLVAGVAAGQATITATYKGVASSGVTLSVTTAASSSSKLVFLTPPPQNIKAHEPFEVRVAVQDTKGITNTTDMSNITLALSGGLPGQTLRGATPRQAVAGVATFSGLSIDLQCQTPYQITASAPGLTSTTSRPIRVAVPSGDHLTVTLTKFSETTYKATVTANLRGGQNSRDFNSPVRVTLTGGPGTLTGQNVTGGEITKDAVSGFAVFPDLVIPADGSTYFFTATSGTMTGVSIPVRAGLDATRLEVSVPQNLTVGQTFDVTVTAKAGAGANALTSWNFTSTVSLSLAGQSGGRPMLKSAVGGVATFAGLRFTAPGTDLVYTATATIGGKRIRVDGRSSPFSVAAAAPPLAAPSITSLSPNTGAAGTLVTATGTGFTSATTVTVAGTTVAITENTATTIKFAIPTGARPGDGAVNVVASNGTLASQGVVFTVAAAAPVNDPVSLQIRAVYVAYGIPVDAAGVAYWTSRRNDGMSLSRIAQSFAAQTEATSRFPFLTNPTADNASAFISTVYSNLFGRTIDAAGLAYWTAQLNAGVPVGSIVANLITGAQGVDLVALNNRASAAATPVATKLVVSKMPATATVGVAFATSASGVRITAKDAQDATVSTATGDVTVSIASGPTGGAFTAGSVLSKALAGGDADFTNLALTTAGTYRLRFTSGTLTVEQEIVVAAAPTVVSVTPGDGTEAATSSIVVVFSVPIQSGTINAQTVVVERGGSVLNMRRTLSTDGTRLTIESPARSAFAAGAYTLKLKTGIRSAAGMALAAEQTSRFSVPQPILKVSQTPAGAVAGRAFTTQPQVTLHVGTGELVSTSTASVTVTASGGPGTLTGTKSVRASGGTATFTDLGITAAGSYTLRFSASGFAPIEVTGFTVAGAESILGSPASGALPAIPAGLRLTPNKASATPGDSVTFTLSSDADPALANYLGEIGKLPDVENKFKVEILGPDRIGLTPRLGIAGIIGGVTFKWAVPASATNGGHTARLLFGETPLGAAEASVTVTRPPAPAGPRLMADKATVTPGDVVTFRLEGEVNGALANYLRRYPGDENSLYALILGPDQNESMDGFKIPSIFGGGTFNWTVPANATNGVHRALVTFGQISSTGITEATFTVTGGAEAHVDAGTRRSASGPMVEIVPTTTATNRLITSEAGGTASFTIALTPQPSSTVHLELSSLQPDEGNVSPNTVNFTSSDWNIPQRFIVTGVDDSLRDGDQAYEIRVANVTSSDRRFDGINVAPVLALNLDDEGTLSGTPSVVISPSTGVTVDSALTCLASLANVVSFSYQWKRNDQAISGATSSTYRTQALDARATITCEATVDRAQAGYSLPVPAPSATSAGVLVAAAAISTASAASSNSPTITSVIPASGTAGIPVTITGTNFRQGMSVTVGGSAATGVSLVGGTSATFTVPSGLSPGAKDVVVTNTDGRAVTSFGGFTVKAAATARSYPVTMEPGQIEQGKQLRIMVEVEKLRMPNSLAPPTRMSIFLGDVAVDLTGWAQKSDLLDLDGDGRTNYFVWSSTVPQNAKTGTYRAVPAVSIENSFVDLGSGEFEVVAAPRLSFATPPAPSGTPTSTSAAVTFKTSGTGDNVRVIALPSGSAAPSAAAVIAATGAAGMAPAVEAATGVDQVVTITDLTPNTAYKFYAALENANVVAPAVSVTTAAASATRSTQSQGTSTTGDPVVTSSATPAVVGSVLSVTNGNWDPAVTITGYQYQWKRGTENIGTGAITYTVAAGDVGQSITCVVTPTVQANASNSQIQALQLQLANLQDQVSDASPTYVLGFKTLIDAVLSNVNSEVDKLNRSITDLNNLINLARTDVPNTVPIPTITPVNSPPAKTSNAVTVAAATPTGPTITVEPATATSGQDVTIVANYGDAPRNLVMNGSPLINIVRASDNVLIASYFGVSNVDGVSTNLLSATMPDGLPAGTFKVQLLLRSSTTPEASVTLIVAEAQVGTLSGTPTVAVTPSGSASVGTELTCLASLANAASFSYQWKRNGQAIGGATEATYTTQALDARATITCEATVDRAQAGYSLPVPAPSATSVGVTVAAAASASQAAASLIIVRPLSTPMATSEAGQVARFNVAIAQRPAGTVTVAFTSSSPNEGTVAPTSIEFDEDNFALPRTITVSGIDDSIVDGDKIYEINLAVTSADAAFRQARVSPVQLTNLDNEVAPSTPPTITSVIPASGTAGIPVTITGTNFRQGMSVTVGGSAATGVSLVGGTSATFTVPSGLSPGAKDVVVTNTDRTTATSIGGFRVIATARVDADGDGSFSDEDCDDNNSSVHPGAAEVCDNGIDDDCDPATPDLFDRDGDGSACNVDCDDADAALNNTDADGDGFSTCQGDPDDGDPSVKPSRSEPSTARTLSGTPTVTITPTENVTVGTNLTCLASLANAMTFKYQWKRNGQAIGNATSARYTTTLADSGARIACEATVTRANDGFSLPTLVPSATSNAVSVTRSAAAGASTTSVGATSLFVRERDWSERGKEAVGLVGTVEVEIRNAAGQALAGDVTVSIASGPAGARLYGTTTASAEGAATFNNLEVSHVGTYNLSFQHGSLPAVTKDVTFTLPSNPNYALPFSNLDPERTPFLVERGGQVRLRLWFPPIVANEMRKAGNEINVRYLQTQDASIASLLPDPGVEERERDGRPQHRLTYTWTVPADAKAPDFYGFLAVSGNDGGQIIVIAPSATIAPATASVGTELTCEVTNQPGIEEWTYQWRRDGTPITGATAEKYTVTAADAGKPITCVITASKVAADVTLPSPAWTATSNSVTVTAATRLGIAGTMPTRVTAWALLPEIKVQVQDGSGALFGSSTATITATLEGEAAELLGTKSVQASGGEAKFSDLRLVGNGDLTLVFSADGLTSSRSTINARGGTIELTTSPSKTATVGEKLAVQPVVTAKDRDGNVFTSMPGNFSLYGGSGEGKLEGGGPVPFVNGVATFTDVKFGEAGTFQLVSSASFTRIQNNASGLGQITVSEPLSNTVKPSITPETPKVGDVLTCAPGTWTPEVATFTYQWMRGTETIGENKPTYTVTAADAGKEISCSVTPATMGIGFTLPTNPPSENAKVTVAASSSTGGSGSSSSTSRPRGGTSGDTGTTSTTRAGGATGTGDTTVRSSGVTYQVGTIANPQFRLTISPESPRAGMRATFTIAPIVPPSGGTLTVAASAEPAAVGSTLTATTAGWVGNPTFTYAWLREADTIANAASATYKVTAADGGKSLFCVVTAMNVDGSASAKSNAIAIPVPPPAVSNLQFTIDAPSANQVITTQPFVTSGWAVDLNATSGSGVDAIHVYTFNIVNGAPDPASAKFVTSGAGGIARPDVRATLGSQFTNSGFSFSLSDIAPGTYDLGIYFHSTVTNQFYPKFVRITIPQPPVPVHNSQLSLDGPTEGQVIDRSVTSSFTCNGWAVDLGAPSGVGVDAIHVYAFPIKNGVVGAGVFIDQATLGGSRPDVAAVFGSQFLNSGFTFLFNTTLLTRGEWYVGVYVHSSVTGQFDANDAGQTKFVKITITGGGTSSISPSHGPTLASADQSGARSETRVSGAEAVGSRLGFLNEVSRIYFYLSNALIGQTDAAITIQILDSTNTEVTSISSNGGAYFWDIPASTAAGTYTAVVRRGEIQVSLPVTFRIQEAELVNTVAPVVSAAPSPAGVGSLLTATDGTWIGSPSAFTYVWLRDGDTISDATRATYTAVAEDAGKPLVCIVTATNTAGSVSARSTAVTVAAAPTITSVAPMRGTTFGGDRITISGTNLAGATAVTIGGAAAVIGNRTATAIEVTTPTGSEGARDVVVSIPAGPVTSARAFTYVGQPTITSITPASGPVTGGTRITLTGTNLQDPGSLLIGGNLATNLAANEAGTEITATTPAGTLGIVSIALVPGHGWGRILRSNVFTYVAAPQGASLSVPPAGAGTIQWIDAAAAAKAANYGIGVYPAASFPGLAEGTLKSIVVPEGYEAVLELKP